MKPDWRMLVPLAVLCVGCSTSAPPREPAESAARRPDLEYEIEGARVRVAPAGADVASIPGAVQYLGHEIEKDLDGDGRADAAFLVTRSAGGSGTFIYLVAAVDKDGEFAGSDGVLLGDRITPRGTASGPGRSIDVTYAERRAGEPMTAAPSVARTRRFLLDPVKLRFGEVALDFEGEADPGRMTLDMKPWTWIEVRYNDGAVVTPRDPARFTLALDAGGTFLATTDCNRLSGTYTTIEGAITFGEIATTRMLCEGSQEDLFARLLREAHRFRFTGRGELILELKFDSGTVRFR